MGWTSKLGIAAISLSLLSAGMAPSAWAGEGQGEVCRIRVGDTNKSGYVDAAGRWIEPPAFDLAFDHKEGRARFRRDGKWGYIDNTGHEVISAQFERAEDFHDGMAAIERNGKYGFIDKTGREVIPARYTSGYRCGNGLYVVQDPYAPQYLLDASGNRVAEFDRQEEARAPEYYKFWRVLGDSDPKKMYLAAGTYIRNGDEAKAKQVFEAIIDRFPDSDFAVKANDQLLAGKRAGDVQKARDDAAREQERMADQINRDARNRAYRACNERMLHADQRQGTVLPGL